MRKGTFEGKALALWGVACLTVAGMATVATLLAPGYALADDVIAHSVDKSGNVTNYTKAYDACVAGYSGDTIVMDADWDLSGTLEIDDSKTLVIDMNGHRIKNNGSSSVIRLREHSNLTLKSTNKVNFDFEYYTSLKDKKSASIYSGGLVTGGHVDGYGGGVRADDDSKLTLDGVSVAGNFGRLHGFTRAAGGIYMTKNCELTMKGEASVEYNRGSSGGVYMGDSGSKIYMENAYIRENVGFSANGGGGVLVYGKNSSIELEKGASISRNESPTGGGIYYYEVNFSLFSKDRTGALASNESTNNDKRPSKYTKGGAAIFIERSTLSSSNGGEIDGISFTGNRSASQAGAIECNQEDVTISNCSFTNNIAEKEAGAIYIGNDDNTLNNCTITGNVCNNASRNYEGGGVFVSSSNDLKISGRMLVKGNTRGWNGNADDVFLDEGLLSNAYLIGSVDRDSKIGVRTGVTGDRCIAKKCSNNGNSPFFMDLGGYYVSYGTDNGGDAWQRHKTLQFLLQLNSSNMGRYAQGSSVAVNGAIANEDSVFWRWDFSRTSGLAPADDYASGDALYNPVLSFSMPQNDVNAVGLYVDRAKNVQLKLSKPEAGKELETTATVVSGDAEQAATVIWYELGADGQEKAVAGVAKPGTSYVARASAEENNKSGLFYSSSIAAENVAVVWGSGEKGSAASASVDTSTGILTVEAAAVKTEGEAPAEDVAGTVSLLLENVGLTFGGSSSDESGSEGTGSSDVGAAMAVDEDEGVDFGLSEKVEVSYTEGSEQVVVTAPAREGYNFNHWEGVPEGVAYDDEAGIVTFEAGDLKEGLELTAMYTPVVTELTVGLDVPVAGKKLASSVGTLVAKGSDGSTADLKAGFSPDKNLSVSWSSDAKGIAAGATAYTAFVDLDDAEGYVDVDKVLAKDVVVTFNGAQMDAASTTFAVRDGRLVLCASFDATADIDAAAAKAVTGKTVSVKANKKTGKTAKAVSAKIKVPATKAGTKASFKVVSKSKQLKVNKKTGKVTLKKGAKKGKTYKAKIKVSYGYSSKTVTVKFKVK